ncbi:unnamed protein product, partial [Mesorhabditis belari]|uniref:Uncharacterized protein n=1 Tax=Mesorhabditis belari TaxID=2138241 RepID=A0AAF3FCD5_9BILA
MTMCELGVPVLYLPDAIGFAEGWLNFLPVQYPFLLPFESKLKLLNWQLWLFWIFVYIFFIFPPPLAGFLLTYTNRAGEMVSLMAPEVVEVFHSNPERVFAYEFHGNSYVLIVVSTYLISITGLGVLSTFFLSSMISGLTAYTMHLSPQTRRIQKEIILLFSVHTSVIAGFLAGGVLIVLTPLLMGIRQQEMNFYGIIFMSLNGIVATPMWIASCKSYRDFIQRLISRAFPKLASRSTIIETTYTKHSTLVQPMKRETRNELY